MERNSAIFDLSKVLGFCNSSLVNLGKVDIIKMIPQINKIELEQYRHINGIFTFSALTVLFCVCDIL